MIIQFNDVNGEVVNTNFVTPQLMATVGPFSKLITYPTYNVPGDYSYSGPYYGNTPPGVNDNPGNPSDNPNAPGGRTEPVEGQLTTSYFVEDTLTPFGPTGSYLFPLGQGGSYIGFYSPTGVLYTKWKMDNAQAASDGIAAIAAALGAGDPYLLLESDGNPTP
jgi:hypothetical protein